MVTCEVGNFFRYDYNRNSVHKIVDIQDGLVSVVQIIFVGDGQYCGTRSYCTTLRHLENSRLHHNLCDRMIGDCFNNCAVCNRMCRYRNNETPLSSVNLFKGKKNMKFFKRNNSRRPSLTVKQINCEV